MKKYFILLIVFSSVVYSFGVEKEHKEIISTEIVIDRIDSDYPVLDEWKNPGLYSPVNMFDGNINTCFAEGHAEIGYHGNIKKISLASGYSSKIRYMSMK